MEGKQNKGQKKVDMKKIESAICKNANELETLCGVEVGILVFSKDGKPLMSYGSPSRLLNHEAPASKAKTKYCPDKDRRRANRKHDELLRQLEGQEKEKTLAKMGVEGTGWWSKPIQELSPEELKQMEGEVDILWEKCVNRLHQLRVRNSDNATEMSTSSTAASGNDNKAGR